MGRLLVPRRKVLQGIGASAGLAACGGSMGSPPPPKGPAARASIDTIVICMMENRSFDHMFGSLSLLEGRTEVDGLQAGWTNPDLDGNLVPIGRVGAPCLDPDPPHGWDSSRTQLDGGTNQGFVRAYQNSNGAGVATANVMSYQTRAELPVSYALADNYALCQRWFSSLLTSTWPNRLYFHAAQSEGQKSNDLPPGGYGMRAIWDQLTEAGVDWGYYFTDLPTLALFGRPEWADHLRFIDQFHADAAAGALPPVVCVDAGAGYDDDHPPHHPMLGQLFIGSIYASLAASPHWDRSLFVLTYDEAGGLFDHVAPGTMADDRASEGFDQLGFRVPGLVMGPYVRPGVYDDPFEHTAALTFIQDRFGITEPLTARNAASGDLGVVLDGDRMAANEPAEPITLPPITLTEDEIEAQCANAGRHTGQPELQAAVQELCPWFDRSRDLPDTARRAWRRAGDQGLWIPG